MFDSACRAVDEHEIDLLIIHWCGVGVEKTSHIVNDWEKSSWVLKIELWVLWLSDTNACWKFLYDRDCLCCNKSTALISDCCDKVTMISNSESSPARSGCSSYSLVTWLSNNWVDYLISCSCVQFSLVHRIAECSCAPSSYYVSSVYTDLRHQACSHLHCRQAFSDLLTLKAVTSENMSSDESSLSAGCLTLFFRTLSMIKSSLSNSVLLKDNCHMLILCLSDFLRHFFLTIRDDNLSESSELLTEFSSLFSAFFVLLIMCSLTFSLFSSLALILFSVSLISSFLKFKFTSIFSSFFTLLI